MNEVTARVSLVRFTPESQELVASAAKLCYAKDTEKLFDQDSGKAKSFVEKLVELGHMSPVEHAAFTFYVEGVSRGMTHQLVRHRLASYSQRSQRYVNHEDFQYIIPPQLKGKKIQTEEGEVLAEDYFAESMRMIADRYSKLNSALGDKGESSNEDARYVLPNACETKIMVTMNARELLHFSEERLCQRAQWEIRDVANQMLALAKEACPAVFEGVGPKCIARGHCPEGKMTCGRYSEMRERYAAKA